jgi:hypothetical protein
MSKLDTQENDKNAKEKTYSLEYSQRTIATFQV